MSRADRPSPKYAPLFDVDPVTGRSIEVFYADRALENVRQDRCWLVLVAAPARVGAHGSGSGPIPVELRGVSPRRDFSGGNQQTLCRHGERSGGCAMQERPRHASILLPPKLCVEAAGFRGLGKASLFSRLLARPKRFELLTPRFVVWCSIQLSYGRVFRGHFGPRGPLLPRAVGTHFLQVAKARHSYRLRPGLARSGKRRLAIDLRPRPFVADAQELHRTIRDRDPEGRADGSFHQMNFPAMGADQFGGDRKPEPAAARPA
jgi:hypothetical protein